MVLRSAAGEIHRPAIESWGVQEATTLSPCRARIGQGIGFEPGQSPRTQRSPSAIAITGKIARRLCLQRDDYWKKDIVGYRKRRGTPVSAGRVDGTKTQKV